jgi:methionyl-tRNA synthetase
MAQDGSYSHEAIVNRMNADLANDLGNLAQRSLSMINKNCGGQGSGLRCAVGSRQVMLAAAKGMLGGMPRAAP